jgi:hypothetical protein
MCLGVCVVSVRVVGREGWSAVRLIVLRSMYIFDLHIVSTYCIYILYCILLLYPIIISYYCILLLYPMIVSFIVSHCCILLLYHIIVSCIVSARMGSLGVLENNFRDPPRTPFKVRPFSYLCVPWDPFWGPSATFWVPFWAWLAKTSVAMGCSVPVPCRLSFSFVFRCQSMNSVQSG